MAPVVLCLPSVKHFEDRLRNWLVKNRCRLTNDGSLYGYNAFTLHTILVKKFKNDEFVCTITTNVRNKEVFVVGSGTSVGNESINDILMQLFITIDALKRACAKRITIVFPMFPYARQDKKDKSRRPITASMLINILYGMGVDHFISMDLHAAQIQGFGPPIPFDNLYSETLLVKRCCQHVQALENIKDVVVMSPDAGGVKRAESFCKSLHVGLGPNYNVKFAMMHKARDVDTGNVRCVDVAGDAKGDVIFIVDDMADSCGTLMELIKQLQERGISNGDNVVPVITHAIFSPPAEERLKNCKHFITTNTCLQTLYDPVDVAPLFGEAIKRSCNGESLSELFAKKSPPPI